ncbi:site-specific integrase [Novispirillum sp. DQ9]|uniref:site-specific integrase n=1 Tax=Novispirillum sp. DQ9 TaxID=3398612 RepID=UPI003C7EB4C0
MSLYKPKGSSFWHYDFVLRGRRFHGSTKTESRADAREVEAAEREKARRTMVLGEAPARPPMSIDLAFGRYYQEVSHRLVVADDDFRAMARLKDMLGAGTLLSELTDDVLARFVSRRRGMKARNKDTLVSAATVNRDVELLRRIWRRAEKVWRVDVGQPPDWGAHLLKEPKERVRELSVDEETRLFKALREDFQPLVYVAMRLGVRFAGLTTLTWKAVNLQAGTMTVTLKGGGKSTKRLPSDVVAVLANQQDRHPIYVFTYVCQKTRGNRKKGERYPFSANGWRKAWADALAAAKIEDLKFHDLRHTAATRVLRATGNLKLVQRLLDHTTIAATVRYAHVDDDDILAALEATSRRIPEEKAEGATKSLKRNGKSA